jgi:uncharacterized delta-60 repeat protein
MTRWRAARPIWLMVVSALLVGLSPVAPAAAVGPFEGIDPSFGQGGIYRLDLSEPSLDVANAVDGQIVAGTAGGRFALTGLDGDAWDSFAEQVIIDFGRPSAAHAIGAFTSDRITAAGSAGNDFAVAAVSKYGDADLGFGDEGRVRTSFGAPAVAFGIANMYEGRVLAVGTVQAGAGSSVGMALYDIRGALVPSFGTGGKLVDDITPGSDSAHFVTTTYTGFEGLKILVAGRAGGAAFVGRYLPNGQPDPAFGTGGRVLLDVTGADDSAYSLAFHQDGLLVAGSAGTEAFVARMSSNGVLDPGFGTAGVRRTTAGGTSARFKAVFALPDDGQLLAMGAVTGTGGEDAVAVRFRADGSIDSTFGTGGRRVVDLEGGSVQVNAATRLAVYGETLLRFAGGNGADMVFATLKEADPGAPPVLASVDFGAPTAEEARVIAVQPNGRIIAAGHGTRGLIVTRLLPDGSPDPTFGAGGVTVVRTIAWANAVSVHDGLIYVLADHPRGSGVFRFTSAGDLDPSWGPGGYVGTTQYGATTMAVLAGGGVFLGGSRSFVVLSPSGDEVSASGGYIKAVDAAPLPDGKFVGLFGQIYGYGASLYRIHPDGTRDSTFHNSTWLTGYPLRADPKAMAPLADGRFVVAAWVPPAEGEPAGDLVLARFTQGGALDSTFGANGVIRTAVPNMDWIVDVAELADGRIVVTHGRNGPTPGDFGGLVQYLPDGRLDEDFGDGGRLAFGGIRPEGAALSADGRVIFAGRILDSGDFIVARSLPASSDLPSSLHPVAPVRVLDTRTGLGSAGGRLQAGGTLALQVAGRGGVPSAGATAVVLNVTVTEPTAGSFLTAWPAGRSRPLASNLNFAAGQTVPNLVVVKLGAGGVVNLYNLSGSAHVIADVAGWYGAGPASPGARYSAITPARILDTRTGDGAPAAKVGAESTISLQVTGRGGVPATGVSAVVLNVTATEPTAGSFLTAWPAGSARPLASNLNYAPGQTAPNLVIVKVGDGGKVNLYNYAGGVHVIADVAGWYGADGATTGALFSSVVPSRTLDTRTGQGTTAAVRLGTGSTLTLQVTGKGGVPASGVSAVILNVTVTEPTAGSFLTVWPAGETRPMASNLNYVVGQTVPNLVAVKVGVGGKVNLYNHSGSVHVIADVAGWYGSA